MRRIDRFAFFSLILGLTACGGGGGDGGSSSVSTNNFPPQVPLTYAGATTGASKQINHLTHQDGRHPEQGSEREHDSSGQRSFTDREVSEYGPSTSACSPR